jgi:hypothetical protein
MTVGLCSWLGARRTRGANVRASAPVALPAASALPVLWRTKLRSTLRGIDHAEQVAHCLENNLVGIGWRIDELPSGASLELVCQTIEENRAQGWGRRAAQTVRRLGQEAEIGDFVWTRDTAGRYLVCKISGGYRYDISEASKRVDVHQVRDVAWAPRALNDLEVPGGVIRRFVGVGSSFSRINDDGARRLTPYLWEKLHGRALPELAITPAEVLASHLDPYDVEDLVYVWLQVARGFVALPRARQRDTPAYEWTMIHRETGRRGIVQIKTGSEPVDLQALADARSDDQTGTYTFAACGKYIGNPELVTEVIGRDALLSFVAEQPALLPVRVRTWFELTSP